MPTLHSKEKLFMPLNLQFFAESAGDQDTPPADDTPPDDGKKNDEDQGKMFSRDELAKMLNAEREKLKKEFEEKETEAKKLEKMNAQEKLDHENQKLKDKIAELERAENLQKMAAEASKMLKEAELPIDPDLINLIVTEESETTSKIIKSVISYVNDVIEKEHIKKNTGRTPEVMGKGGKDVTPASTTEILNKNRIV